MKDLFEKLKNMDKKELGEMVKQAKAFSQTPEGKEILEKIKSGEAMKEAGIDKEKQENIMKAIGKDPSIAQTIFDILNGKR